MITDKLASMACKAAVKDVYKRQVRENANVRVYGRLGALKNYKKKNPEMVIAMCGCCLLYTSRLRADHVYAQVIEVELKDKNFRRKSHQTVLDYSTNLSLIHI